MTRVMFWNIQQLSVNKVDNPSPKRQRGSSVRMTNASTVRMQLMSELIGEVGPDILVIVELQGGSGVLGTLVNQNAIDAVEVVMNNLPAGWRCVPPLCSGGREGVAILYRENSLIFSGPYRWQGGVGPPGNAAAVPAPAAYAAPLNGLIGNRVVPEGAAYNGNEQEETLAAQTTGWTAPVGGPALALAPRVPYLATFAEINGAGAFQRDISVFGIHAPANVAQAIPYLAELARTQEIVGAPAVGEARLLGGDFNINLLLEPPGAAQGTLDPGYAPLRAPAGPFTLALVPAALPVGGFPAAGKGYYATHIKAWRPTFWAPNTDYPGYGYISKRFWAIDNIFHRGGAPANFSIVNPVTGTPFVARPAPPGYAPPPVALPIIRRAGLPLPPAALEPPIVPTAGERISFRGWNNFGKIRSLSDHFAVAMDV